jgi:hypothetical protein
MHLNPTRNPDMASIDSIALATEEPAELVLKHPVTGEPIYDKAGKPAFVLLLGKDSAAAKKHGRSQAQKIIDKRGRGKTKAEELEASNVELLVALTKGWYLVSFAGEPIEFECTPANARALYTDSKFDWIKDQVDEFSGDRSGFLKSSEAAS